MSAPRRRGIVRIGIDIGGTFTDFAVWHGEAAGYSAVRSFKIPSSPPKFADAVKAGIDRLLDSRSITPEDDVVLVHGTTVSTNAVIERAGPDLALLVTAGFRDLLGLQRLRLQDPTNLFGQRTLPLIPRSNVFEVTERIEPDGSITVPLSVENAVDSARLARERGVSGIVVCFLHSYRNPVHEMRVKDAIRDARLGIDVTLSSEVWPQQGEYERAVAAVLNAYVKSLMSDYLGEIQNYLAERLPRAKLFIARSNGGLMSADEARAFPVHTLLSGPSAGVTAAQFLGAALNIDRILTMDMGGTSTDLALIWEGQPTVTTQAAIGDFPLMMPVTGIEAIGAGGGSIATMNASVLNVGPRSAGARPGPACYGRGGTLPTLSDAYLLCGYLDSTTFLAGEMPLSVDLAHAAMNPIAVALNRPVIDAAEACIDVATSNMVASILPYLARVGVDPRELTLLVYGGAGAIHGPLLAEEIGLERVLIPRIPSVFCAFGGLVSDLVHDVVRSVHGRPMSAEVLRDVYAELASAAHAWLAKQVDSALLVDIRLQYLAEMRYIGQSFQVDVSLPIDLIDAGDHLGAAHRFHLEHERLYSHRSESPVEFINLRVRIAGSVEMPRALPEVAAARDVQDALVSRRPAFLRGRNYPETPVYGRDRLVPGVRVAGLAFIEQGNATILVPPSFVADVGPLGDIVLTRRD